MPGRMEGRVAFITGAARGIGRSTAVLLAREGADIIGMDIAGPIRSAQAPASSPDDLARTVDEVEAQGRRMVTYECDVRDEQPLTDGLARAVGELGRLDTVVCNAEIGGPTVPIDQYPADAFRDVVGERSDQPVPDREGCDPAPTRARERRLHRADQLRAGLARHAEHRCVHLGPSTASWA
jgi:hypothetical protein